MNEDKAKRYDEARARGMSHEQAIEFAEQGSGDRPGRLESLGRGLAQGVTLGFADEMAAGVRAIGDGTYSEEVAKSRQQDAAAREDHPWMMGTGEVLGSIAPAAVGGIAAMGGKGAARVGARVLASGAGMGALDAAGRAEGDPGERLPAAAVGAVGGALVSNVAAPVLGWAGQKVAGGLGVNLRRPATRAADELLDALEGEPSRLAARATGAPGETAMELDEGVRALAETSNLYPHARRGEMRQFIENRARDQFPQAKEALEGATGFRREGTLRLTRQIMTERSNNARQMFPTAYARGQVLITPRLQQIMQTPAGKAAFTRGKRIAMNALDAQPLVGAADFADDAAQTFVLPDVRTLHYIKMGLDDNLRALRNARGLGSHEEHNINGIRRALLEEIRGLKDVRGQPVTELAEALEEYAGDSAMAEALDMGRSRFHLDAPDDIRVLLDGMTAGEQEMYRRGALDNMVNNLGQITDPNTRIRTFLEAPNWQERLELLASDGDELRGALQRLRGLAAQGETRGVVLRNSATAGRETRREAFEQTGMGTRFSPRTMLDEVAAGNRSSAATEKAEALTPLLTNQDLPSLVQLLEGRAGERLSAGRRAAMGRRLAGMQAGGGLAALVFGSEEEGR